MKNLIKIRSFFWILALISFLIGFIFVTLGYDNLVILAGASVGISLGIVLGISVYCWITNKIKDEI